MTAPRTVTIAGQTVELDPGYYARMGIPDPGAPSVPPPPGYPHPQAGLQGFTPWQGIGGGLSSLGAGLLAAGGQGGWNNFGPAFLQQQQIGQQQQGDYQRQQILAQKFAQEQEDRQRQQAKADEAEAAAAAQKAASDAAIDGLVQSGKIDAATGNVLKATGQGPSYSDLTKGSEAPKTVGGMQFDPKTGSFVPIPGYTEQAQAIAAAGRAPQQPREAGDQWAAYTDPKTGRTGQKSSKTGKIDWDPNQGAGIQVDTNNDGIPDITVGGSGMTPPTGAAAQSNIRGLLISQGLEDIANVDFDNVSAGKMALGEAAQSKGSVGELGAGLFLNDDEKRLIGAQGAIQEAVISAITGAAYSEEQKRNMRGKYVVLPTDSASRRAEKTKAAAQFLKQLDINSGETRVPTEKQATPKGATTVDGYTITPVGD